VISRFLAAISRHLGRAIRTVYSQGVRLKEWEAEADDERSEAKGSAHA
jgi:hypothetical protein